MKKTMIFKCLVPDCSFSGPYVQMEFHRKSRHYNEKIDEIIFEDEREKKNQRDAIKRFFLNRFLAETAKYSEPAK